MSQSLAKVSINNDCPTRIQWLTRGGFHVWRHFAGPLNDSVVLSWEKADALREMAKGIPGWDSGASFAPNPLTFEDIDVEDTDNEC
jgi:hypothetical protein